MNIQLENNRLMCNCNQVTPVTAAGVGSSFIHSIVAHSYHPLSLSSSLNVLHLEYLVCSVDIVSKLLPGSFNVRYVSEESLHKDTSDKTPGHPYGCMIAGSEIYQL